MSPLDDTPGMVGRSLRRGLVVAFVAVLGVWLLRWRKDAKAREAGTVACLATGASRETCDGLVTRFHDECFARTEIHHSRFERNEPRLDATGYARCLTMGPERFDEERLARTR